MDLSEILKLTGRDAATLARTADAATQGQIVFLLTKIKGKDHRALMRHLRGENAIESIRDDFERYAAMSANDAAQVMSAIGAMLPLSALIAITFIVQSVKNGEPVRIDTQHVAPATVVEDDHAIRNDDAEFFARVFDKLTTERIVLTVTQWAETRRYLPSSVTSMPGFYSFKVTPYLREIADCMSVGSPIREIDVMKGAQIGATVGILENTVGYFAEHIKGTPMMLLTAEAELAKIRVETYIMPMFRHSKMEHLIQSEEDDKRKTGRTAKKIEFLGGGFLLPYGALNANKLRSVSLRILLEDEVDTFPDTVGKDGDPQELARARLQAFYEVRKNARMSTPLIKGKSRIKKSYDRGDQRKFFVPCKSCTRMQFLEFRKTHTNGERYGLVWDEENGIVQLDTVRYLCKFCAHPHRNSDKTFMLERGEWRATAVSRDPEHRSYHLPALYSPVGMYPWEAIAKFWNECWDDAVDQVRDVAKMQTFYNNVLGVPFAVMATRIRFSSVSAHRRSAYSLGQIPNAFAVRHCGSAVLFLVCTVDVHVRSLNVGVFGITRDFRTFLIDYQVIEAKEKEADASELGSPVWGQLRAIIEEQVWAADDGKIYKIALTLVDAGYSNDTVCTFCADYATGVFPILGRDAPGKNQTVKEFDDFTTQAGTRGYKVWVDHYKDRIAPILRREWLEDGGNPQKPYHFNAPVNLSDKHLQELTKEERRERKDATTGRVSYYWHRPNGAANELWDLLVYAHAAVEIMAYSICRETFELENVDWPKLWDYLEFENLLYSESEGE